MTEARWMVLVVLLVVLAGSAAYYLGCAGEESLSPQCALCGAPPGEHAVVVLPNEQEGIVLRREGEPAIFLGSKPFTVCAPCYRQAVGVDKQEEGEDKTQTSP